MRGQTDHPLARAALSNLRTSGIAAQLTAPTDGVSGPTLTLLLQAGEVMHELLDRPPSLRGQTRGRGVLHRGGGSEQLVGATIRTAQITEVQRNADPLTGAGNRRQLDRDLPMLLNENSAYPLSLLMLDLDNFKIVNDIYGHPVGDAVLRHIVEVVRENLRPGDRLFRYGGEEFCVVLPAATPIAASAAAGRICRAVERTPYSLSADRPLRVTVSIGVATASGDKPADLIARADSALYNAKSAGRNRVVTS